MTSHLSSDYLLKTSRDYSLYVCEHRGIPKVTDGLKEVQRMALWLLRNKAEKIKTVALTGAMAMERIYVHGDAPCNEAISQLAAPYKNNVCLIDGHGAFGSRVYPDSWGQARYTEVQRSKLAQQLLYKDLDIVPLEDNYDGSNQQPRHFLPLIPLVLLNGISGIAVGWSTNILPHDLRSLIDATRAAVSGKPLKPLLPHYSRYGIKVTSLGSNRWEFGGQVRITDAHTVQITELPPGLSIENFRKRLIEMETAEQIRSFVDRSTEAVDIIVKLPRGSEPLTKDTAMEFFKLRERVTERIVVVDWDDGAIRTYDNPETVVVDFVAWRLGWYGKRFDFLIRRDSYELTYWLALRLLFDAAFPKKLGTFLHRAAMQEVVATITHELGLDAAQMDRIVGLPTYRWTQEFAAEVVQQIADLQTAISQYQEILASPDRLRQIYLQELDELRGIK